MPQTFFQDFNRDNGNPITVEYSYSPGGETDYSPAFGASGGDPCEVTIVSSWPNTPAYERLSGILFDLRWSRHKFKWWQLPAVWVADKIVGATQWVWGLRARLTTSERERMEGWIAERHVFEPSEEDYF